VKQKILFSFLATIFLINFVGSSIGQSEKLFGYGGHDFNSFFSEHDLASLNSNVTRILKDQITMGDWFAAQDFAQKQLIPDDTRLWFCQELKNERYYQPFVNCQEAIYDQSLYQNMYKMYSTKLLIQHAKKIANQDNVEVSSQLNQNQTK
jgi:hypothetical protein